MLDVRHCKVCGNLISKGEVSGWVHVPPFTVAGVNDHAPEPATTTSPATDSNIAVADIREPRHYDLANGPRTAVVQIDVARDLVKQLDKLVEVLYSGGQVDPLVVAILKGMGYIPREPSYRERLGAELAQQFGPDAVQVIGHSSFSEIETFVKDRWEGDPHESGLDIYVQIDPALFSDWGIDPGGLLVPCVMRKDTDGDLILTVSDARAHESRES